MLSKEKQLVVVSIVEGRNFPRRPRFHLVAEAKFDGEVLATDPVHHDESPLIEQELGWSLDSKALHQYRLQRTAIRVQLFAVDSHTTAKETIGYVTLDLRSATDNKQVKWCSVLHSRYARREGTRSVRPELNIGIYMDDDQQPLVDNPAAGMNPEDLEPILNEAEGYYQLGNYKICSDRFLISVTVANAKNLTQLIPSDVPLTSAGTGFYFYFKLFGNPVVNEPFSDLVRPNFPVERSSVRVRSSLEVLWAYFRHHSPIYLYLCCGQESLGVCSIPVHNIFKEGADFSQPVSIEGVFTLERPGGPSVGGTGEGEQPTVGVSVSLRRELPPVTQTQKKSNPGKKKTANPKTVSGPIRFWPTVDFDDPEVKAMLDPQMNSIIASPPLPPPVPALQPPAATEDVEEPQMDEEVQQIHERTEMEASQVDDDDDDEDLHRFSFTLELGAIRDLQVGDNHPRNIFIRYVYPFFGSATPIMTHPAVEVRRNQEIPLPQGLCEFQLAVRPTQLRQQFLAEPLILEVRERDKERATMEVLGTARIDLSPAMDQREVAFDVPVIKVGPEAGKGSRLADLGVRLTLLDLGIVASPSPSPVNVRTEEEKSRRNHHSKSALSPAPRQQPGVRETAEYRAAVELELWKQAAEEEFQQKLAAECTKRLKSISVEWQKREKEREMLIKKKTAELQSMKSTLESTSRDLENREKQVAHKEQELARLRAELTREHERKVGEARDAARRLEQDCEHKVALERTKGKHLVEQLEQARNESQEWERRFRAAERDLIRSREKAANAPESRLQSELAISQTERAELERRLEAASVAKERYKVQYLNTLKELARVRKRERSKDVEALKRRERELAHLRLRHLAAEERSLVTAKEDANRRQDEGMMSELRQGIEKLRSETHTALSELREEKQAVKKVVEEKRCSPMLGGDAATNDYLQQLMRVRESLLKDSLYDPEDLVVQELEQRIREAMQNPGLDAQRCL